MPSSFEQSTHSTLGPRRIQDGRAPWRLWARDLALNALLGLLSLAALQLLKPFAQLPAWALSALSLYCGAALYSLNRFGGIGLLGFALPAGLLYLMPEAAAPAGLDTGVATLAICILPWTGLLMYRPWLTRLGFSGRLRRLSDLVYFATVTGLVLPGLTWVSTLALGYFGSTSAKLDWPQLPAIAMGLLTACAALYASGRRGRQGRREVGWALGAVALALQLALSLQALPTPLLLLPHVVLALHASRSSARQTGALAAVLVALSLATGPVWASLGLALLPWIAQALGVHGRRERDGWRGALDAQGMALAEWRLPVKAGGGVRASQRWLALTSDPEGNHWAQGPLDWVHQIHPRDKESVRQNLRQLLAQAGSDHLAQELRLAPDGGDWCWHELHVQVARRDRAGRALDVVATLADVSGRHLAEERERMTAALFQHVQEGLAVLDSHWRVVEANPVYCQIVGLPREALIGHTAAPLTQRLLRRHSLDLAQVQSALAGGRIWRAELLLEREHLPPLPVEVKLSTVAEPEGAATRWRVLGLADRSEAVSRQEQLHRLLRFDAATGLPNREEFMARFEPALRAARRDGHRLVVCLIDLDDFATLNITHGQLLADAVLQQVALRLQGALRASPSGADMLARLQGDEFAVLVKVQTAEEALRAVERLSTVLCLPLPVRESQVGRSISIDVSASIGATVFPVDDADPETLLRHASHALYRAKQAGRGSVQFHDPSSAQRSEAGLLALARLQRALDEGELCLHYQPQIDLRSGQVVGAEALLRWQHPERGLLPAALFLPLTESTGLAVQIGDWVIEQALAQLERWRQDGLGLALSVNIGARQLRRADFPQRLQELLQRSAPENAALLNLDVLEADALAHTDAAQALIQRCVALGVGVALDDFGAGFSNLSAMKRLPAETLKLSCRLVQGMLADAQDRSLVLSVIGLARNIGCAVVAKGVESPAHARELLRVGCRLGQGNAIAAAMPAEALPGWMAGFAASNWPAQIEGGQPPLKAPR